MLVGRGPGQLQLQGPLFEILRRLEALQAVLAQRRHGRAVDGGSGVVVVVVVAVVVDRIGMESMCRGRRLWYLQPGRGAAAAARPADVGGYWEKGVRRRRVRRCWYLEVDCV